jgi:hypothetical protein
MATAPMLLSGRCWRFLTLWGTVFMAILASSPCNTGVSSY